MLGTLKLDAIGRYIQSSQRPTGYTLLQKLHASSQPLRIMAQSLPQSRGTKVSKAVPAQLQDRYTISRQSGDRRVTHTVYKLSLRLALLSSGWT